LNQNQFSSLRLPLCWMQMAATAERKEVELTVCSEVLKKLILDRTPNFSPLLELYILLYSVDSVSGPYSVPNQSCIFKIHCNIIHYRMFRSEKWSFSFMFVRPKFFINFSWEKNYYL
jgi:hypothetical protein